MKRLIKANPVAVALVIVFLLLIVVGVLTTKGAEPRATEGRKAATGLLQPAQTGRFA